MSRTQHELVYERLVDGHRAKHAQPYAAEELTAAAIRLAEGFNGAGWRKWASMITDAGDPAAPHFERVFQGIEVVRRFGPIRDDGDLETLVVSSGRFWEPWQQRGGS